MLHHGTSLWGWGLSMPLPPAGRGPGNGASASHFCLEKSSSPQRDSLEKAQYKGQDLKPLPWLFQWDPGNVTQQWDVTHLPLVSVFLSGRQLTGENYMLVHPGWLLCHLCLSELNFLGLLRMKRIRFFWPIATPWLVQVGPGLSEAFTTINYIYHLLYPPAFQPYFLYSLISSLTDTTVASRECSL